MKSKPLLIEKVFDAPPELVWQAITDNSKMKQWYFDIAAFKPEPGFEFQFIGGSEEKQYVHLCKIMEVIPGRKLSYSWKYKNYSGESLLSFELFPEGERKTLVKLTHKGLETFPRDSKDFAIESFTAGWNSILGESLRKFVEGASLG